MSPHRSKQLAERVADLDVHFLSSGKAFVMNQRGTSYEVDGDHCECADFARRNGGTYDGRCKHIWAVKLSEPCPACNGTMRYTSQPNGYKGFECPSCGCSMMASVVMQDRKAAIEEETDEEIRREDPNFAREVWIAPAEMY